MNKSEVLLVGVDFTDRKDINVLTVGKQINGRIEIINAFRGQDAEDIYKKLTTGEVADRLKKDLEEPK